MYGPQYVQGDVVGVGYRPRTGTIFFTRNGKRLEDVANGLKSQNLFPAVGAIGPCTVHVNFGQSGFVFIEANVKKWGLAPMTGSLAPPPPYGSDHGSILLETGRERPQTSPGQFADLRCGRIRNDNPEQGNGLPTSPGPVRSPTDISLNPLTYINLSHGARLTNNPTVDHFPTQNSNIIQLDSHQAQHPPPEYSSPQSSDLEASQPRDNQMLPLIPKKNSTPPIPSYNDAVAGREGREQSSGYFSHQVRNNNQNNTDESDISFGEMRT